MSHLDKNLLCSAQEFAGQAVETLSTSTSPFNFVQTAKEKLKENGFAQIFEKDPWDLKPGDKVFYTRNKSSIYMITVGEKFDPKTSCFKILGAHTDSPSLRIAPNSYNPSDGLERYNIQIYGGALWHTWLDRDLSICGKVLYRTNEGKINCEIIRSEEKLFYIPNCPPHLKENRSDISVNTECHLKPIIGTVTVSDLLDENKEEFQDKKLGKTLAKVIIKELQKVDKNVTIKDIVDYDLVLYDTQKPTLAGVNKELLISGRLDNLGSSVPALYATIESSCKENLAKQTSVNITALFDNEEIGSLTFQGADSNFFLLHLERIYESLCKINSRDGFMSFCARSFGISADLAHAFNPNFSEKFQPNHRPHLQKGVVVKINVQGKYSTDSVNGAVIKQIAAKANVPLQEFIVRQNGPCGTTIGPIISAKLGIRQADIGIPQWAMHSIRECLGVIDLYYYKQLFVQFLNCGEEAFGTLLDD